MPLKEVSPLCAFLCVAQMLPCSAYRHALQCQRFSRLLCVYLCVYVYICIRCSVKPYPSSVWAASNAPPPFRNEIQLFFMGFLPCYMPCFASASIRLLLLFARNAYLIFSFIGVNGTLSPPRIARWGLEVPTHPLAPLLVGCNYLFPALLGSLCLGCTGATFHFSTLQPLPCPCFVLVALSKVQRSPVLRLCVGVRSDAPGFFDCH